MKKGLLILLLVFLVSCSNNIEKKGNISQKNIKTIENKKEIIKKDIEDKKNDNKDIFSQNFSKIEKLLNDNKTIEAETLLKEENKNNLGILKLYSILYFKKKEYKKALQTQKLLNNEKLGKDSDVLYFLGVIYDNLGDKQNAKKYIEKSLEVNPSFNLAKKYLENFTENKIFKFEQLMNAKKYKEALELLKKNYKKESFDDNRNFVRVNISLGKYENALQNALIANKISNGKNYEILYFLGVIYDNLQNKQKAKEYLQKSLKINPDFISSKKYLKTLESNKNNINKNK